MSTPGRASTSRLRSKTSDLSDLLRGARNEHRHAEQSPVPDAQNEPRKHKLSFFGRKRKSSTVSIASRGSESRVEQEGDVPPLPQSSANRQPTRATAGPSPPLPSVLVSPPSFSTFSNLIHSRSIKRLSDSHAEQKTKAGSAIPVPTLNRLRPEKSTSFEFTRRSDESQNAVSVPPTAAATRKAPLGSRLKGSRPTITVSAPPHSADDDRDNDITPRASHTPYSRSPPPQVSSLKTRRKAQDSPESPRSDSSRPPSPQTPVPFPAPSRQRHAEIEKSSDPESASRRPSTNASSAASTRVARGFAMLKSKTSRERLTQKRASAVPAAAARVAAEAVSDDDGSKSAPEPSMRTTLPFRPAPSTSTASPTRSGPTTASPPTQAGSTSSLRSRIPSTTASSISRGKVPPPVTAGARKARGGPPTEPLPSPPSSTPASTRSINRVTSDESDSGTSLSTMPSIPSVASTRMSVGQVHQLLFRHRGGTSVSVASTTSTGSGTLASSGSSPPVSADRESSNPPSALREQFFTENRAVQAARARLSAHGDDQPPPVGAHLTTVEELREALQGQSAKYQRLTAYLLTLSERHAVEKSELMRRIETLEREAKKREREITGLRWLVMNAGSGNAAAAGNGNGNGAAAKESQSQSAAKPSPATRMRERMRSGSVSSSQGSHKGARKPSATNPPPEHASSTDSHGDHESIEEGLFEMQQSVSDLIAPSPPASDAVVSPGPVSAGGRTSSRRSNTSSLSQANGRRTRRTSSSLSGAATGLDINVTDLPSIPSLADSEPGYGVSPTSSSSSTGSIPSLTGANSTASSGLSAIPESPATPVRSSVEKGITDALKEQEQVRRRSKRESVVLGSPRTPRRQSSISTPSSASPPTAHSGNVKMGASPSIGQVLDRVSVSDAEAVPRRLRSK